MTILGHNNYIITAANAIANGIFIEGASRWGLDPVWRKINLPYQEVLFEFQTKK